MAHITVAETAHVATNADLEASPDPKTRRKKTAEGVPHIPRPPKMSMKPDQFFLYWAEVEEKFPGRCQAYVYRTWPRINRQILDEDANKYIDIWGEPLLPADEWRAEFLHRWGSGDYKLILADPATRKNVAQTMVTNLADPEYPPVINNLDELVMDYDGNQSYIQNLRQKGILPGEREMAGAEAMSILAGTVKDLSAQATAAAAQSKKEPVVQPQTAAEVATKTIEMADKAFQQGITLAKEVAASQVKAAEAKATAAEAKVTAAEAEATPSKSISMLRDLAALMKEFQPPAPVVNPTAAQAAQATALAGESLVDRFMARVTDLQAHVLRMNEDRVTALEKTITELRAQPASTVPAGKQDDLIANLEKLANMKERLQGLFGGGEPPDEKQEKVPAWMSLTQSVMTGLPTAATALLAMSYNMAIARTGTGTPIPPAAETPSLPPATDTPQSTTGEKPMGNAIAVFLGQIERPLINHLNDPSKTGADFADWVSSGYGDIGYQAAKELGKDTLMALLGSRLTIASVIQQIPERTSQFIDEFLHADEMTYDGDDEPPAPDNPRTFVAAAEGAAQIIDVPPIVRNQEGARRRTVPKPPAA